jgi:hypothetical protein
VHATYAVTALGFWAQRNGDPSAAAPVRRTLVPGSSSALRAASCNALSLARDREAGPLVLRIAEGHDEETLRAVAVASAPPIADPGEAGEVLRRLLAATQPPEVRREAASALGALGDVSAAAALRSLAEESDRLYVRAAALVALGRIGGPGALEKLRTTLENREAEGLLRGLSAVGLGILLERASPRPLRLVGEDLDWNAMTDAVSELLSIL